MPYCAVLSSQLTLKKNLKGDWELGAAGSAAGPSAAPFRTGSILPSTCDETIREFFFLTANNTLYSCNGPNLWAMLNAAGSGAPIPSTGPKQTFEWYTVPAEDRPIDVPFTVTLSKAAAPGTMVLVFLRSSQMAGDAMDANWADGRIVRPLFPNYFPYRGDRILIVYTTFE